MLCALCVCVCDYHNKLVIPITTHSYKYIFLVLRTFMLLPTIKIQYAVVNYSHHAVHYIPRIYFYFHPFPQAPHPNTLPLENTNLFFVSMSSVFFRFYII